jgi:hypothetical protein
MFRMLRLFMGLVACSLCSRQELLLEILALRQQLAVLKGQRCRPRLTTPDRVFWVMLRAILVGVEGHACDRPAADSCRLASGRFQTVLDMALTA